MKKLLKRIAIVCSMIAVVLGGIRNSTAQVPLWGQCGGIGYTGSTTCSSGTYCSVMNQFYSQCLPGGSGGGSAGGCPSRCSGGGCGASQCTITASTIPGTGGGGASKSVTATDGYFACCYSDVITIYAQAYPNSCCPL